MIPFDFESKFDNGEYGQTVGDMLWTKLQRQGGFIIPESMQDVRDWCQRTKMLPGPDTPLEKMKEIVVKEQAGDIGIWGKVERVAGFETDVYDFWINVADFSVTPPRMLYQKKARTQTVSEIPHVYVKEALDRLYGRTEQVAGAPDPKLQERWEKAPNLVKGDFEQGRGAPVGWDPLPHDVTWVAEKGKDAKSPNKVIRFTMNEDVAGTTGVLYYSDFFPVEEGATYRFQCRWRTTGSAAKVFVKCYDELPTEFRTGASGRFAQDREARGLPQPAESPGQRRRLERSDRGLHAPAHPVHPALGTRDALCLLAGRNGRVGRCRRQADCPAPPRKGEKDRRPSTETKVRTREMQEDPLAPRDPPPPGPLLPAGEADQPDPQTHLIQPCLCPCWMNPDRDRSRCAGKQH